MVESIDGNTLADRVMKNVLQYHAPEYQVRSFLKRGSDERQYNAPGVELPYISFCRSKYGEYPEYHTSADDMTVVSPEGFQGSFDVMKKCIMALEYNFKYKVTCYGEPQLGKRNLYPTISYKGSVSKETMKMRNLIAYCNGKRDLIEISNKIGTPVDELIPSVQKLLKEGLLVKEEK
jgi:aminopeptidase-like protein